MILGPQYHGTEEAFVLTRSFKQVQAQRPGEPDEEPGEEHAPPHQEPDEPEEEDDTEEDDTVIHEHEHEHIPGEPGHEHPADPAESA